MASADRHGSSARCHYLSSVKYCDIPEAETRTLAWRSHLAPSLLYAGLNRRTRGLLAAKEISWPNPVKVTEYSVAYPRGISHFILLG